MSRKHHSAFKAAAIIESAEFDEKFAPPTHILADLGSDQIADHNLFVDQFYEVITKLSKGSTMFNGDFE